MQAERSLKTVFNTKLCIHQQKNIAMKRQNSMYHEYQTIAIITVWDDVTVFGILVKYMHMNITAIKNMYNHTV